ncbi:MAG: hypothetical protein KJZ65_09275 [Phycisphaerales bacterium]|nr:hypothetical protein [Phycisphaerales bacterium]
MSNAPRPRLESLLADELAPAAPKPRRQRWDRRVDRRMRAGVASLWARPRARLALGIGTGLLALGVAVGAFFHFRPVPQPDFRTANIDVLFNYALLTDEFNKLPIEKRLELIAELVRRLRSIDADQSLLMAAFAAQITGQVRTQFEKNASLLAVDLFDKYAEEFDPKAPPADRDRYVENTFIEFQKTLEKLAGEERNISDEDRLIEGRRQAKRDLEFVQSGRMPVENTVRMITFLNNGVGQHASGHQKIRINSMISQMVKTLREGEVPPEAEQPRRRRDRDQSAEQTAPAPGAQSAGPSAGEPGESPADQPMGDPADAAPEKDGSEDGTPNDADGENPPEDQPPTNKDGDGKPDKPDGDLP